MSNKISIPAIRVEQPIGEFFSAVISAEDLLRISSADMRRIESDLDMYVGIQRKLDSKRVAEIGKFVESVDATFPTSIVLAVSGEFARYDPEDKVLNFFEKNEETGGEIKLEDLAKILDGQHRVEGLRAATRRRFDVPISVFVDADIADQAYVFATVNLAQTKVNKSLVYDLLDYARARSPQKSAHDIAVALDKFEAGPFHHMIKRLGTATPGRKPGQETLAQATFVGSLLPLISGAAEDDRYALAKGRKVKIDEWPYEKTPFRQLWVNERDTEIAQILLNFFAAVVEKWPDAWKTRESGHVLPRTNGFRALMRVMAAIYRAERPIADLDNPVVSKQDFAKYLQRVQIEGGDFNSTRYNPGSGGEAAIARDIAEGAGVSLK
ncbi:MAG: DGQHR domain-containing protein [Stenotrophomonas geniculata]